MKVNNKGVRVDLNMTAWGIYMVVQATLLVVQYGFVKTLPWWVAWFPSVLIIGGLAVALAVMLLTMLAAVITGIFK